jgi:DMSO/TMAO reductase YedYZ molybdopterin-dependent catalytic subunit
MSLPPGQIARPDFPRFGLTPYAKRFPKRLHDRALTIKILGASAMTLTDAFAGLQRVTLEADFHCVTTWSKLGLRWGGVRFADFFAANIAPQLADPTAIMGVVLRAQDGYRTTLPLADLLAPDVLIADQLDGQPLSVEHGAPLRILAPQHYGYKSLKHLERLEFYDHLPKIKNGVFAFLDHSRARVSLEERGRYFPGWLLRRLYRPLISRTVVRFRDALQQHLSGHQGPID